jgi:hypothetical protein
MNKIDELVAKAEALVARVDAICAARHDAAPSSKDYDLSMPKNPRAFKQRAEDIENHMNKFPKGSKEREAAQEALDILREGWQEQR